MAGGGAPPPDPYDRGRDPAHRQSTSPQPGPRVGLIGTSSPTALRSTRRVRSRRPYGSGPLAVGAILRCRTDGMTEAEALARVRVRPGRVQTDDSKEGPRVRREAQPFPAEVGVQRPRPRRHAPAAGQRARCHQMSMRSPLRRHPPRRRSRHARAPRSPPHVRARTCGARLTTSRWTASSPARRDRPRRRADRDDPRFGAAGRPACAALVPDAHVVVFGLPRR
jgi:hypothetical protein